MEKQEFIKQIGAADAYLKTQWKKRGFTDGICDMIHLFFSGNTHKVTSAFAHFSIPKYISPGCCNYWIGPRAKYRYYLKRRYVLWKFKRHCLKTKEYLEWS